MGDPTIAGAGDRGAGPLPSGAAPPSSDYQADQGRPPDPQPAGLVTPRSSRSALAGSPPGTPAPAACPARPACRQRQEDDEAVGRAGLAGLRFVSLALSPVPVVRITMPATLALARPLVVLAAPAGRPCVRLLAMRRAGLGSGPRRRLQRRAGRGPRDRGRLGCGTWRRGLGGCRCSQRGHGRKARRQGRHRRGSAGCGRGRPRGRWARANHRSRRDARAGRRLRGRRRATRSRRGREGQFGCRRGCRLRSGTECRGRRNRRRR